MALMIRRLGLLLLVEACAACTVTTLTAFTGSLDSSDYFGGEPDQGAEFCFVILPRDSDGSPATRVELVFESVSIPADELQVYDGSSVVFESLVWSCPRCGSVLPPPILSRSGAAYVKFRSSTGLAASFKLSWFGESDEMAGSYRLALKMAQATLRGPLLANGLAMPRSLRYEWAIQPADCTVPCQVTLMLEELRVAPGDKITVINGQTDITSQIIAVFDSSTDEAKALGKWYKSTDADGMLVRLETGVVDGEGGFQARYLADAPVCSAGTYCDCGEVGSDSVTPTLKGPTMLLSDGTVSAAGMDMDACKWLVDPSGIEEQALLTWPPLSFEAWLPRLTLVAEVVSMKRTSLIRVYDGPDSSSALLWDCRGCESVAPPPLEASGSELYVEYESDANSEFYQDPLNPNVLRAWTGWRMVYWADGLESASTGGAGSSQLELRAAAADSVRAPFSSVGDQGYAAYLGYYSWLVDPPSVGDLLRLVFNRLILRCPSDELKVLSMTGTVLATYNCASPDPPSEWVVSPASEGIELQLTTAAATGEGVVDFAYFSDAPKYRCGHVREPGVLSAPSFLLSDGSSPNDAMYASADCSWLLAPKPGSGLLDVESVSLIVTRLDLAGGVLSVHDGMDATAPLLWRCEGCNLQPPPLTSSGPTLFITLTTTSAEAVLTGTGFDARYYSSYPGSRGAGDSMFPLFAAAAPSVRAPTYNGTLTPNLDLLWIIDVGGTSSRITLALAYIDLGCGEDKLTVYDGAGTLATVLGVFCGSEGSIDWLVSSSSTMTLRLETGSAPRGRGFDASYFSERAQAGCGGALFSPPSLLLPAPMAGDATTTSTVLRAGSFLFSDGSAALDPARSSELCEWHIRPFDYKEADAQVVLQFPRLDLGGIGVLNVTDTSGRPLFRCDARLGGCQAPPSTLVVNCTANSTCGMVVKYASFAGVSGTGFLGHYFTVKTPPPTPPEGLLLAQPVESNSQRWRLRPSVTDTLWNDDSAWRVAMDPVGRSMVNGTAADGNEADPQVFLATVGRRLCGELHGAESVAMVLTDSMLQEASWFGLEKNFQYETAEEGQRVFIQDDDGTYVLPAASTCIWSVEPRLVDPQWISMVLTTTLVLASDSSLAVYAGTSNRGRELFECTGCLTRAGENCCFGKTAGVSLATTSCSQLYIELTRNSTSEQETQLAFATTIGAARVGARAAWDLCTDDPGFLLKQESSDKQEFPQSGIVALSISSSLLFIAMVAATAFFLYRRHHSERSVNARKYTLGYSSFHGAKAINPQLKHARYYGGWVHSLWNRLLLKKGECAICYGDDARVLLLAPCKHAVCVTCLEMYAQAALGDISMFPLRCPLHHTGCKTTIADTQARRVLTRPEYKKFCEFYDRTILGDGTHCFKCGCFVNLDAGGEPQVQCPYCAYRWCVKCKCPWHPNVRCDERAEVELEEWRELKGAQNCPGCSKIIEKDDPETCNHMVHKLTDAMPCVRERTDFCYCCGCEVLPDYPHCEQDAPDTSHFPDGVFQDCRAVKLGYATMLQKRRHNRHRKEAGENDEVEPLVAVATEIIGTNSFGNYFGSSSSSTPTATATTRSSHTRMARVSPIDDDDATLSEAERRRRRREGREAEARARRLGDLVVTADDDDDHARRHTSNSTPTRTSRTSRTPNRAHTHHHHPTGDHTPNNPASSRTAPLSRNNSDRSVASNRSASSATGPRTTPTARHRGTGTSPKTTR